MISLHVAARQVSRFYDLDPADPDSPVRLDAYSGPHHGEVREGDLAVYENPAWRQPDGTYKTGGMDGTFAVTELIAIDSQVTAILDNGGWEVSADNLRSVMRRPGSAE